MKHTRHESTPATPDPSVVVIDLTDGDDDETFEFEIEIEIDMTPTSTSITADGTLIRRYDLGRLTLSAEPDVSDDHELETLIDATIVGLEDAA